MANAKKCDRCGTFYEPRKKNSETLSVSKHKMTWGVIEEVKHSDLCFTCQLSLLEWFKVGSENLEEEAYRLAKAVRFVSREEIGR